MVGWLRIPAATFVMMVVWAAVYYLLPNVYVAHFGNFGVTYGALGTLVVLLVWMWLSSLALMLGAEINAVIRKTRR
jgi:membrane protein